MPPEVTLAVMQGTLAGQEFRFQDRNVCLVGRSRDCGIRLPDDSHHMNVSRHHCLLDVNPPYVRVRDFGSLNGTYVNGEKIGQRKRGQTPTEAARSPFPERDLRDGDEVMLGETLLKVHLAIPALCAECQQEIPKEHEAECKESPDRFRCLECRRKAAAAPSHVASAGDRRLCGHCGCDLADEPEGERSNQNLCDDCKRDAQRLVERLLGMARNGKNKPPALAGYQLLKELGRGAMGAVFLALREETNERVAIKLMLPEVAVQERNKAMFLREAQIARALTHPNLVRVEKLGFSDGVFFVVMEHCAGGSVGELQRQSGGKIPSAVAVPLVLQALAGLEYAHRAPVSVMLPDGKETQAIGVVHRDLKPDNLLLSGSDPSRVVKIGDFGLAKAFDLAGLSGHSNTGAAAGTLLFMPRQQLINYKYALPEVDVWAMAASLYFLLTGLPPRDFPPGKDPIAVVLESSAVPIRRRLTSVSRKLAGVIDLALIDKPEIHFSTAADFRRALEKAH